MSMHQWMIEVTPMICQCGYVGEMMKELHVLRNLFQICLFEEATFFRNPCFITTVTKARLQAISAPQAHAWLKVQPSPKLGLALMPDEAQVILKWWLGLPLTPEGTPCPLCHHNMDAWGHHMLTCRSGGD